MPDLSNHLTLLDRIAAIAIFLGYISTQMVLESKNQSPPVMILRPMTLHLGSTHQEVNNNSGVKTLVTDDDVELARNKRRKKRRSADVSLKRFSGKEPFHGKVNLTGKIKTSVAGLRVGLGGFKPTHFQKRHP